MVEFLAEWLIGSWSLWLDMAPYLLLGFIMAGLLHVYLGEHLVRRHFSANRFSSVLKATLFGIPLPVCSCGVIPLAESLRQDGASKGATLAFLISTPTSGVDSIMATYGLMGPMFAVLRPLAGLLAGLGVGVLTQLIDPGQDKVNEKKEPASTGCPLVKATAGKNWQDVFRYGLMQIPRDTGKWLLIGTLAGGLVTELIPQGFIENQLHSPMLQYLSVLLMAIPIYICATAAIPLAMGLMVAGLLPGAALMLLVAGPATSTVTLAFVFKRMGARVTLIYLGSLSAVTLLMGLMTDALFSGIGHSAILQHLHRHEHGVSPWGLGIAAAMLLLMLWQLGPWTRLWTWLFSSREENHQPLAVHVPDMSCQICEEKIRQRFSQTVGLESVRVDLDKKKVRFGQESLRQTVCRELEQMGYHPEEN